MLGIAAPYYCIALYEIPCRTFAIFLKAAILRKIFFQHPSRIYLDKIVWVIY